MLNPEYIYIGVFVLPYSKYTIINKEYFCKDLEYIGICRAKWYSDNETAETTHLKIAAILIYTTFLVSNWVKKNDDNIDELVNLIEKH